MFFIKFFVDIVFFIGMAICWNDSVVEWDIFIIELESWGELCLIFVAQDDWSCWQYCIGEGVGIIW